MKFVVQLVDSFFKGDFVIQMDRCNPDSYYSLLDCFDYVLIKFYYECPLVIYVFWHLKHWVFIMQVKLVKCLVQNIVVDISFNQLGGL